MAKKYYAWKNANCNGHNPEWIELSGMEFLNFKRKPENKKRCFIEMYPTETSEDVLIIEATKDKYDEWHKENMRYLRMKEKYGDAYTFLSLDCEQEKNCSLYDEISSDEDIEGQVIRNEDYAKLQEAIAQLNKDEWFILNALYFSDEKITERELANKLGISFQLMNYKKKKILEKLKKVF